ncbi:hypothetical protein ACFQI7_19335 [Paenibacillus allorhizosphaerae]|uniref:Uncharacterized protein n=1 Tax=Paenibacillus allorhizosphaerae TaxID=2849866 RepID=A0ABN7TUE1_9BACL|nr:hypothetical protein [Paenibacillus allorhizosphaerae]CAG7652063.1 hypothetical protein PAECIP111802_05126 [Paenibacillus allorhizosphaerae]
MTIVHSIPCDGSEVSVRITPDRTYQVNIQTLVNPLGTGKVLETFSEAEEAVQAAELFCELHKSAKELGYHLEEGFFVKADQPSYHVGMLLRKGTKPEELVVMMEKG